MGHCRPPQFVMLSHSTTGGRDDMRARTMASDPFAPLGGINTTPLIDVMLVLLVMFIIIMPRATHEVPMNLPQGSGKADDAPTHMLQLDAAGALQWDGQAITPQALPAKLAAMKAGPTAPKLMIKTDGDTPYLRFDQTLSVVDKAGIDRLGFIGNERFAHAID
ncbi:ExbD/TolR family protein [Sphingomonas zeicaulis]|uniref:ExbD/TolR family protein n=1 Tax=Sphingomonas zeicaulis TaxID=1632740 RepID=UPI003D1ECEE9